MVDVVQLVEHRIVVPSVVGSSPIIHPKRKALFTEGFFFWTMKKIIQPSALRYPLPNPPLGGGLAVRRRRAGLQALSLRSPNHPTLYYQ